MIKLKSKRAVLSIILLTLIFAFPRCNPAEKPLTENQIQLSTYNVIWDSPSKDHNGSMPIGNGDIGLNVWVEESGDICFYIGKTDSWGDNGRLLKVGMVRVACEPAIVFPEATFKQELDLKTGSIKISSSGIVNNKKVDFKLNLWVDANNPVVNFSYEASVPVKMTARIELWRNRPFELKDAMFSDFMQSHSDAKKMREKVIVEPDIIEKGSKNEIVWYHHNIKASGFDYINNLQGMTDYPKLNPILNRTFGALLKGDSATSLGDTSVATKQAKSGKLCVYVLTKHPSKPEEWKSAMTTLVEETEKISFQKRKVAHEKWWTDFWNRSWIYATSTDELKVANSSNDAYVVTRAYNLQRFIDACAGRGKHPIKFNGSIFTVPPKKGTPSGDADYRRWGPGYWWQNTRLPYLSMCATGDYDLLQPLFKMYGEDIFEVCKQRTKKNFGFEGAYFPECMYFWGAQFPIDYGPKPWGERTDKLQDSRYHKWEWVAGPELVFMMLDYYDYTQDVDFLKEKIIPVANNIMKFFNSFYKTNDNGKLEMYPSQAAETWWDCTNPMPELAGLHAITKRLLNLPVALSAKSDRQLWKAISSKLPEIPLRDTPSGKALAPASRFEQKKNVENPELYAVFPFRLYGVGQPNPEYGENALKHLWDKGSFGWRQDDLFMTYLGLTDQAKKYLVNRASTFDKASRFPAFWGPNYDWTPDQDHGGVMMKAFQTMLIQADPYSKKIYLTPAWPKDWNAEFKLHAPYNTVIEGAVINGKLELKSVTPESRRGDIIICNNEE